MSKAIAIHWSDDRLAYAVAEDGHVEALESVTLDAGLEASSIGHRLAESLASHSPSRATVIVAVSRENLEWQHLALPPCPAEELPDLVRLQADHEFKGGDEDVGFDYLPLTGDEETSYQVLTVSIDAGLIAKIREACRAASLTLQRIVPLASGWPTITRQTASADSQSTRIYVAPEERNATLWATRRGSVVLFRQFQLASTDEQESRTRAMLNELRRTLLSLSQQADNGNPTIALVGRQQGHVAELAKLLNDKLGTSVAFLDVAADQPTLSNQDLVTSALPLAGLAIDETHSKKPLVDLLHPHRRPQTEINVRTYSLAALAGVLFLALLAWTGYATLQAPLEQAAVDQAELDLLEESLDDLSAYEQRAAAIRSWRSEAPNFLLHIQQLSELFRPRSLDDEEFPVERDVLLEKLDLNKRQLTINALARNRQSVLPLETRLRQRQYGPQRGASGPSETNKDYPWQFKSTIDVTTASDPTSAAPDEEPQS